MEFPRRLGAVMVATWLVSTAWIVARTRGADAPYLNADLPPLMEFLDGTPVRTMEDLKRRKREIRRLFCQYFIGSFPEEAPAIIGAEILQERKQEDGSTRRRSRCRDRLSSLRLVKRVNICLGDFIRRKASRYLHDLLRQPVFTVNHHS